MWPDRKIFIKHVNSESVEAVVAEVVGALSAQQ
jgi:hypothetical protein